MQSVYKRKGKTKGNPAKTFVLLNDTFTLFE